MELDINKKEIILNFCSDWYGTILDSYDDYEEGCDCFVIVCMDSYTTRITVYQDNRVNILNVDDDIFDIRRNEELEELLNEF